MAARSLDLSHFKLPVFLYCVFNRLPDLYEFGKIFAQRTVLKSIDHAR
jgi:hypothetical protein